MYRTVQYLVITFLFALFHSYGSYVVLADETLSALSGKVINADNKPLPGAIVMLSLDDYACADTTDTDGYFRFVYMPQGKYMLTVSAAHLGFQDIRKSIAVPADGDTDLEIMVRDRTYHIDEVVVLSGHEEVPKDMEKLPSFVTVVERSEFENTATTVADVIMAAPSANISVMGGLGDYTEVSLRGSYSNQVQIYIDGMLLNEAIGGAVNLGTIPLTNVESIEVWRSGAPAQFGGDAVGGVINIKTRDIHTPQKTFSLGYGSFNSFSANAVINIPHGMSRFNVTADYSSSDNDFKYKSDNGTIYNKDDDYWARRYNDEYLSSNLMSKYNHLFGNGMFLELSEHILSNKKNIPGKDYIRYSHATFETVKNLFQAKMTINPLFSGVIEAQPVFYHIHTHERYKDTKGNVGTGFQDNIYNTNKFNFMIPFTLRVKNYLTVNITPAANHESFRPDFLLEETLMYTCDREHFALSGNALFKTPGEKLTLTSNLRRDRYFSSYTGKPSPYNKTSGKSHFDYLTNSQAGLKLRALENFYIKCNYGDITRIPSLYELFGDRGGTLSNPDLKPEHIYKWDAGCMILLKKNLFSINGSFECAYFESNYKDLIQWYATDAGFIHPDNVSGSYVKGTEIVWNTRFLNRLMYSGSWTFQNSEVTSEKRKFYRNKQLPNRPKNFGSMKLEYSLKNTALFWTINRKSSYYLDRTNQNHLLYPGRTLQDIGISVLFMGGKTICSVLAKNITDIHTFDVKNMPKPGRSYMFSIVYSLN